MPAVFAEIGAYVFTWAEGIGISTEVVSAIGTILEYAAIAELLNVAQQALAPSGKSGVGQGLVTNYASTEASIRIIYGTVKCGGEQTIPPITYGRSSDDVFDSAVHREIPGIQSAQQDSDLLTLPWPLHGVERNPAWRSHSCGHLA